MPLPSQYACSCYPGRILNPRSSRNFCKGDTTSLALTLGVWARQRQCLSHITPIHLS